MKKLFNLFGLCIAASLLPGLSPAQAKPGQAIDNAWNICAEQTALMERRNAIPKHLLNAISLAESGRWNASRQVNVAWPWTVTSGGEGRYFDTKAEALAEVEILMTEGVRNIDVGCMQINLYYHADAFGTLDEAFDPAANTTYAAAYLKNMFAVTGDWVEAAGYYHSTTPERNGPYKKKVLAYWRGNKKSRGGPKNTPVGSRLVLITPIDHTRMAQLTKRFRARKEAARNGGLGKDGGTDGETKDGIKTLESTAAKELNAWRDARSRGLGMTHLLAMRRAEFKLKQKRKLDRLGQGNKEDTFTAKRTKQLRDWRLRISNRGKTAPGKLGAAVAFQKPRLSATSMAAGAAGASVR